MVTNEQARINAGRANGSLSAEEANRLQSRLNDINALKFQISRDGVSAADQQLIDQQLDQLSQQIYRESNDRQMLGSKPWGWSNNYRPNNNDWNYGHWNNGKWESKNNWNQYNNWRAKNWHNEWNRNNNNNNWNNRRADGQRGSGITPQEQAKINKERMKLQRKHAQASADGRLDYHERKQLEQRQNRINQQERRDRRD